MLSAGAGGGLQEVKARAEVDGDSDLEGSPPSKKVTTW